MKRSLQFLLALFAVGIIGFVAYNLATTVKATGHVTDFEGKPVSGAMIQVAVVNGRNARIPNKGTFVTMTNSSGNYEVVVVNGKGKRFMVLTFKDGYEPQSRVFDERPTTQSLSFSLQNELPFEPHSYSSHDKVIARDGEWCNAEIVMVGGPSSPTVNGPRDMSGKFEVRWDDWGTTQWLPAKQVRPRPSVPLDSSISCPSISKQELADTVMKSVNEKLGR